MPQVRRIDFWAKAIAARSPAMLEHLQGVARALVAARRAMRTTLPPEFVNNPPMDLLYTVFLADDHCATLPPLIAATGVSAPVARRWIDLLVERDLVYESAGMIRLTDAGLILVAETCQAVIASQTGVDEMSLN
ncbi:hypothetical protein [Sphingomonas sp. RIT328]|nr:hypothetical protein [Sphingomonas sp. RIT328]EZP50243.1 hypothetical protein BW41_03200 [Sphingomonas sp. RIT328]